jgi:two-component system sensor histidine kinase KdpD
VRSRFFVAYQLAALVAVAVATASLRWLGVVSPTTVALTYLLVVLFAASSTTLAVAVGTSVAAMLSLNYFFMPPVGTFTIADPHNWVALVAFLVVAVVASHLSSTARARATEAIERRNELTRLFDLSRDVLLTTDGEGATAAVARHVARRFEFPIVTVAVARDAGGWDVFQGAEPSDIDTSYYDRAWASARGAIEFDAKSRSYGGQQTVPLPSGPAAIVPIRIGLRPVGLVVLGGKTTEPGTADAIAGIVAIAIERSRFLEDRRLSELSRQRADLTSALLAALGHDLRTPLTAIRVAVTNAADGSLAADVRAEQSRLALEEIAHLARLLQEILDMARIEAHAVRSEPAWVTAGAIVEAAAAHAGTALARHRLVVDAEEAIEVQLDPRLTSAALAHVLENAAKYSPEGTTITVTATAPPDGLRVTVGDEGPGLRDEELERLFEPFVRGRVSRAAVGTGLGLAITRGLLAAEGGRIWADTDRTRGARFTIAVPAPQRPMVPEEAWP